jgi:hypothetical protein
MGECRGAVAACVLLLLLAAFAWRSVEDNDVGIHLAGGRWIAEHGEVPHTDPFTWTISDHETVAYHWLFQLAVHGAHEVAGGAGLVVLRFGLLLAAGLLLVDALRVRGVSALAGSTVALAALFASEWRFTLRPELASFVLATATLAIVERQRTTGRAPLWLLPLLALLWVNLHVWVFAVALFLPYAAEECLRRRSLKTPLVGAGLVAFAALFVNPYGWRAVAYPLLLATRLGEENTFAQHIAELISPFRLAPDPRDAFTRGPQLEAFRLLWLCGLAAALWHAWRRRVADAGVLLVFAALAATAARNVAPFAIVTAPAIAAAFDDALAPARQQPRSRPFLGAACALLLLTAAIQLPRVLSGRIYAENRRETRFAARLCAPCLAIDAADWVAAHDLQGRGLNNLKFGGILAWRDPGRPIFIDARNEVTGEAFYREYRRAMDPARWSETVARHQLEYVALAHRGHLLSWELAGAIQADPDWRLVYLDASGAVFVRIAGPNGHLAAAVLPEPLLPAERRRRWAAWPAPKEGPARLWSWLVSTEADAGSPHHLGGFLLALGLPDRAEGPLLEAVIRGPEAWEPALNLGVAYRELGLNGLALRAFRRAHALVPDHPDLVALGEAGPSAP